MNIGIVTAEVPYPDNSGGRKYTWERIKVLKKLGNNIYLYSIKDEEVCERDKKELGRYCSEVLFYERRKGKFDILLNMDKPYSAFSRYNKKMQEQIKINSDNGEIDILIVDTPQLMYNIPLKCRIPIVLTQHNIEYQTFISIGRKSNNLLKKALFMFEGYKLKKYEEYWYKKNIISLFTFISKQDMEFFEERYNKESVLIPMGVECSASYIEKNKIGKKIVFVGKMSYYPNEEAAIWFSKSILPKIKDKLADVEFYIVGKEPNKEVLDLKDKSIIVTGKVEDINEFVDMADIIVIPLLSGGGVKIKLLEALSRNKIVITTSKGIEGTEFKDKEHVIVADNELEFAKKCEEILINREKYSYLISNSMKLLKNNYSWDSIGDIYNMALEKLYEESKKANKTTKDEVYILHEYDSKSHFSALYRAKEKGDIVIKDYIILSRLTIIKRFVKNILIEKTIIESSKRFIKEIKKTFKLKQIKNSTLIVGIAPYNKLLNRYANVFKNNKSIYFTSWQDWSGNEFPRGNIKNRETYEKILKENFYSVACVSKKTESEVSKFFNEREVVNHSINIKEYSQKVLYSKDVSKKKFIYLGQLIERKNIRLIIDYIKNNLDDIEVSFAGDGELTNEIVNESRKDERIKYLGKLRKSEIKTILKDYDFLILPSKEEPFGIVLIEALASGVPCIVSDCYGPKEIIEHGYNGYIFDKNSKLEFEKVMNNAINLGYEELNRLSLNSLKSSENYDCESVFEKWKKLIN